MIFSIIVLCLIQFILIFEANSVLTITPYLSEYYNIAPSHIVIISMGFAIAGLVAPIFGKGGDKYGKKIFILIGLGFIIFGMIITAFSYNTLMFILGRGVIGIGYYSLSGLIIAYVSDLFNYEYRGKIVGYIRLSFSLGILISPYLGSQAVLNIGIKCYYLLLALITAIIFILSMFINNTHSKHKKEINNKFQISNIFEILHLEGAVEILLINTLFTVPGVLVFGYYSIFLTENGMNQQQVSIVHTLIGVAAIIGTFIVTIFNDQMNKLRFLLLSISIVTIFTMPLVAVSKLLYVFSFLFTVGYDMGLSSLQIVASEVSIEKRASFMTVLYLWVSIKDIILYIIGPILYQFNGFLIILVICTICVIVSLILLLRVKHKYGDKFS